MEPAESIGDTNLLMKIIQNNPYRLLGVFSNSPLKERLANNNKLKAFLKVGKEASIPLDRIEFLPHLHRTEESVSSAEAMLTLPADQIKYAQFWFIKQSPLDEVAFNHLLNGETEKALSIWAKKDYVSSLQNRAICALMQSDVAEALRCFTQLYNSDEHLRDFVIAVTGDDSNYSQELLTHSLLDTLCEESDVYEILPSLSDTSWKEYVGQRTVTPLIQSIEEEIALAKKTKGEGCTVRLNAGNKLKNATRENLQTLKQLLPVDDIRYQMIADKLGIEILQCGIDYYNGSDATDAARNAMILQKYALSIVVGKLAKDRCQENVNILQKIIDNLPPKEVAPESAAIEQELHNYCKLPDKIEHAVTLLNNCKPHLKSIKNKLGANNAFYLKISTKIAGNALHNLIEEVNEAQDLLSGEDVNNPLVIIKISYIKKKVKEAWEATLIIDTFDMELDFRKERYGRNRESLKDLCNSLGIETSIQQQPTPSPSPKPAYRQPTPNPSPKPVNTPQARPQHTQETSSSNSDSNHSSAFSGYMLACCFIIIVGVLIFIFSKSNKNSEVNHLPSNEHYAADSVASDSVASDSATEDTYIYY